eukprot:9692929-Alexandrium_andersonii.AAC.1
MGIRPGSCGPPSEGPARPRVCGMPQRTNPQRPFGLTCSAMAAFRACLQGAMSMLGLLWWRTLQPHGASTAEDWANEVLDPPYRVRAV